MGSKTCENCGAIFLRKPKDSESQWLDRAFCSYKCSNNGKELEPLHVRFWRNVDRRPSNRCWLWTGSFGEDGYGRLSYGGRSRNRAVRAHRLSYEMHYGPISEGMGICHVCDTPACVNPTHLYEGTQKDNAADMVRRGRLNPKSLQNLRPGSEGWHGAGPLSNLELSHCQDQ